MASAEGVQMEVQNHGFGGLKWMAHYGRIFFPALGNENRELKIGKERYRLKSYSRFDETFVTNSLDLNQVRQEKSEIFMIFWSKRKRDVKILSNFASDKD
jgi:hypothetical protein